MCRKIAKKKRKKWKGTEESVMTGGKFYFRAHRRVESKSVVLNKKWIKQKDEKQRERYRPKYVSESGGNTAHCPPEKQSRKRGQKAGSFRSKVTWLSNTAKTEQSMHWEITLSVISRFITGLRQGVWRGGRGGLSTLRCGSRDRPIILLYVMTTSAKP